MTYDTKPRLSLTAWTLATMLVAPPVIAQETDQEYTARILEFTTEPFFLTPSVDHLPASATVPTPLEILGHIVGAPDVLSYPEEVYGYMRAVADALPRVKVFSMGQTEEGREMILSTDLRRGDDRKPQRIQGHAGTPGGPTEDNSRRGGSARGDRQADLLGHGSH